MTYQELFHEIGRELRLNPSMTDQILANMRLDIGIKPEDTVCVNGHPATPQELADMKAGFVRHTGGMLGHLAAGNRPVVERELERCERVIEAHLRKN